MSTTHRSDGPLLPGYHHSGDRGLGRMAQDFPGTGQHGPSLPFPGLVFPADTGKEIICRIVTVPPLLTLFEVDELGRVTAEGPDGVHTGLAEGFADGVSYGTYPFYVVIGGGTLSGGIATDAAVASGALAQAPAPVLAVTTDALWDELGTLLAGVVIAKVIATRLSDLTQIATWTNVATDSGGQLRLPHASLTAVPTIITTASADGANAGAKVYTPA